MGLGALCCLILLLLSACSRAGSPSPEATPEVQTTPSLNALQVRTFEDLWQTIDENYVYRDELDESWGAARERYLARLQGGLEPAEFSELVREFLSELPPDAVIWESREERIAQDLADEASYEGIGAFISFRAQPEPRVILLSIIPGSPAEAAGLAAHDSILAIGGEPVAVEEGLDVVDRIRGPAGSQVTLTVRSPGSEPREVAVTRGRIVATDRLKVGVVPETDIGYMLFPPFPYEGLSQDVLFALQQLTAEGDNQLAGLVLDFRIAGTGVVWPLAEMLTMFADGELGEFYTRAERETLVLEGEEFFSSQSVPLILLVGRDTRGSPEMFAAALQAIGRATVIGVPTEGVVEGMREFPLPDGSRLFLATTSYRGPDGRELGRLGVEPTIVVEADWDEVTLGDDPVLGAAVDLLLSEGGSGGSSRFERRW